MYSKVAATALGLTILVLLGVLTLTPHHQSFQMMSPTRPIAWGLPVRAPVGVGQPVRLKIPVIGVDATVEPVGLTSNGEMGIPVQPADAAWFAPGVRPGEVGSAVIDGHFGWTNGSAAVFDHLNNLQKGDQLLVEDDRGVIIGFVVREIRIYDQNAEAASVFSSTDGKAHLNLITCEGVWNEKARRYAGRLVIFSDRQ